MRAREHPALRPPAGERFNSAVQDWFDLKCALLTAESVALSALGRRESRGAQIREDFPRMDPAFAKNQVVALRDGELSTDWIPVVRRGFELATLEAAE
jgi:succinate dehydrogenase/fumarate reductase flavoprotein subunit